IKRKILTLNGQGGLQGAGPVAVAELAGVEVVRGELACPRRLEVRGDLGDRQAAGGGALVQGAVDPRHVGDAGPAEEAPAARGQRQVEQDGPVGDGGYQRAQVGEQLAWAGVQDVVDADSAGHEGGASGAVRQPGQLVLYDVP